MPRGRIYTDDQIAHAKALLATGSTGTQVTKITGIPKQTISRWQSELDRHMKDARVTDLMLKHLDTASTALMSIMKECGDTEWIKKQRGHDRAMLMKVISETVFRILSAMETDDVPTEPTYDESPFEVGE